MVAAVGIDLGGTKIACGLVDGAGRIIHRASAPSVSDPVTLIDTMSILVEELEPGGSSGVGLGAAGLIDFERGRYLYGPNTGLQDLDLPGLLAERTGRMVRMDNDANCAAWAEHRYGAGRGARHLLCVTLGTGIGGGFVFDGRPYRGAHGGAAEIGHMLVEPDGRPCGCGRRGCWEQYASGQALQRLGRALVPGDGRSLLADMAQGDPELVFGPMVTEAARAGDEGALGVVHEVARWVGWGLASLVNALEPERIVISGGLVSDWDLLAAEVVAAMHGRAEAPEHRPMPPVVPADLGPEAGLVGAALLVQIAP